MPGFRVTVVSRQTYYFTFMELIMLSDEENALGKGRRKEPRSFSQSWRLGWEGQHAVWGQQVMPCDLGSESSGWNLVRGSVERGSCRTMVRDLNVLCTSVFVLNMSSKHQTYVCNCRLDEATWLSHST